MARYRVKAGSAVVRVAGVDKYLGKGAILPDGVENLKHLLEVGLLAEIPAPEKSQAAKPAAK